VQLTLVVVAADHASLKGFDCSFLEPTHKTVLIANTAKWSLAEIGNWYLNRETGVVGLCHADCTFNDGALAAFLMEAEQGKVCGIVGRSETQEYKVGYRWCFQTPGDVSTLDSCSIFLRTDIGLRFDEKTFDGYHCHVEDVCLQAQARKIPVVVPAADARHVGVNWLQRYEGHVWLADYQRYRELLVKKWPDFSFATT